MTAFRFLCRSPGETGWTCYFALTSFNTPEGAAALAKRWNRKDRGRLEWRADECLPGDIDHPDMRAVVEQRRQRYLAKASKTCGAA